MTQLVKWNVSAEVQMKAFALSATSQSVGADGCSEL